MYSFKNDNIEIQTVIFRQEHIPTDGFLRMFDAQGQEMIVPGFNVGSNGNVLGMNQSYLSASVTRHAIQKHTWDCVKSCRRLYPKKIYVYALLREDDPGSMGIISDDKPLNNLNAVYAYTQ